MYMYIHVVMYSMDDNLNSVHVNFYALTVHVEYFTAFII